jgi:hypothetical protein
MPTTPQTADAPQTADPAQTEDAPRTEDAPTGLAQGGLDPRPVGHPAQPSRGPVKPAARSVVTGIDKGGVDISTVHPDRWRAGKPMPLSYRRIGGVHLVDRRAGGDRLYDFPQEDPGGPVVGTIPEPEKLNPMRG